MGLFGFGKDRKGTMDTENRAPGSDAGASGPDLATLKAEARKSGNRAHGVGGAGAKKGAQRAQEQTERIVSEEELADLFKAEQWEEIAALYPNIRFVMTGDNAFHMSERERKLSGVTLAATAKVLLKIDPAYIAMIVFFANYGGIVGRMEAQHYATKQRAKQAPPRRPE